MAESKVLSMKSITIYTDGSCKATTKVGGWSCILMQDDHYREASGGQLETTSQQMELRAVIEAISMVKKPSRIRVYSDSQYIVNAHNEGWLEVWLSENFKLVDGSDRANRNLWVELMFVSAQHNVSYIKVKGHSDNKYNNRCDWLASMARRQLEGLEVG